MYVKGELELICNGGKQAISSITDYKGKGACNLLLCTFNDVRCFMYA